MTTTREAALEAALKRSTEGWANALELGLIPERHRNTAFILRDAGFAALSTPATEPQGYVVKPLVWDGNETDCYVSCDMGSVSYELIVSDTLERSCDYVWVATYHDGKAPAIPLGHGTFLEAQTAAQAHHENRIGGFLAARPAPQPAADTRLVTVAQLTELHSIAEGYPSGMKKQRELIRAIIGNATPAPSDKIAEAAQMTHPLTNALAMRTMASVLAARAAAPIGCAKVPFEIATDILALPLEADHAALLAEAVRLPEIAQAKAALKLVAAILQAEQARLSGKPCTGEWSIPSLGIRSTVTAALDTADAALLALETP